MARVNNDPSLCKNLSASIQGVQSCESNVLAVAIASGASIPSCSVFVGAAQTDCISYEKNGFRVPIASPMIPGILQMKPILDKKNVVLF